MECSGGIYERKPAMLQLCNALCDEIVRINMHELKGRVDICHELAKGRECL